MYSGGTLYGAGGTSLGVPVFAGILALTGIGVAFNGGGSAGFGNVNPELYSLAASLAQTTSSPFHDIQTGDNMVPCAATTPDCWSGSFGFRAGPGYDLATGLGTPIVSNFQSYFQAPTTTSLSVSPAQVTQGAQVNLTATVRSFDGGIPAGALEVDDGYEPVAGGAALDATGALVMSYTPSRGGPHSLTAKYGGGSRYAGSTSGPVSVTVIPPAPGGAHTLHPAQWRRGRTGPHRAGLVFPRRLGDL